MSLEGLSLELLDKLLVESRKLASTTWPYTGTNDLVRSVEAEYERRGLELPENR